MPAFDAAATIEETLDSLAAQRFAQWEAVVVDDGSRDETAAVVARRALADPRIRLVRTPNRGVSAARNTGIAEARGQWLVFLDADDLLLPDHMARLLRRADTTGAHWVLGRWERFAVDGRTTAGPPLPPLDAMFERLAGHCFVCIHACLVRHDAVVAVGGFDASLITCEDWDLWLRLARAGVAAAAVDEVVAAYRTRPGSASSDGVELLRTGLGVMALAERSDARVPVPADAWRDGVGRSLDVERAHFAAWTAGLVLGSGGDPCPLVDLLEVSPLLGVDPDSIGACIFDAAPLPAGADAHWWIAHFDSVAGAVARFASALEARVNGRGFAVAVTRAIEQRILATTTRRPVTVGSVHACAVDVTRPLVDLRVPCVVERVTVEVQAAGEVVGVVLLPACDGVVPAPLVADAIAAAHGWELLRRRFAANEYRRRGIADDPETHDLVGWDVLLREVWGDDALDSVNAYEPADAALAAGNAPALDVIDARRAPLVRVEVAEPLPAPPQTPRVHLSVAVGGADVAIVPMGVSDGHWAERVRAAANTALGFELCVAVVREAVLGRPFTDPTTLRERLATAARDRRARARTIPAPGELVIGRWPDVRVGHPAARRLMLPGSAAPVAIALAAKRGMPRRGTASGARRVIVESTSTWRTWPEAPLPEAVVPTLVKRIRRRIARARAERDTRSAAEAVAQATEHVPVLMYHRVANDVRGPLARWSVTPAQLDEQLGYLAAQGYRAATVDDLVHAIGGRRALPGPAVVITFDDGYVDTAEAAWPIVRAHGFQAIVYAVAGRLGGTNDWDADVAEGAAPLLDAAALRDLHDDGMAVGSHAFSHRPLTALPFADVADEVLRSRLVLEDVLQAPVTSFAHPFGLRDELVDHAVAAAGYRSAVTVVPWYATPTDDPLRLPRFEVTADDTMAAFARKVAARGATAGGVPVSG